MSRIYNKISDRFTLADLGLSWIIFFTIVYQKLLAIGFILMLISLFFNRKKIMKSQFVYYFSHGPVPFFVLYYALLVLGLFWTDNLMFALSKLENKMSFVLMPLLLLFTVRKWGDLEWKKLLIYSLTFALSMYELLAIWRFLTESENSWQFEFLSSRFSIFMHRSYFACYLVVGIILLFQKVRQNFSITTIFLILFFSLGVLQTESKAGFLSFSLVIVFQLFDLLKSKKKMSIWLSISVVLVIFSGLFITNNSLQSRFKRMCSALENIQTKNNDSVESNQARIIMWSTSLDVWKENFVFGTGTGDYDDELTKKNLKYHNNGVASERLNSHNQFLNIAVQLGIVGLVVLLMIFISSFLNSEKQLWQLLILVVFFINLLVESFLETQAGIILFCTLLLLFYTRNKDEELSIIN
jgi:O-antigen ligase